MCVLVNSTDRTGVPIPYDFLALATGVTHSYFGRNEFEKFAPGLKSLAGAVAIRNLRSMSLRMMTETVAAQKLNKSSVS